MCYYITKQSTWWPNSFLQEVSHAGSGRCWQPAAATSGRRRRGLFPAGETMARQLQMTTPTELHLYPSSPASHAYSSSSSRSSTSHILFLCLLILTEILKIISRTKTRIMTRLRAWPTVSKRSALHTPTHTHTHPKHVRTPTHTHKQARIIIKTKSHPPK